jgi:hypothetical protein
MFRPIAVLALMTLTTMAAAQPAPAPAPAPAAKAARATAQTPAVAPTAPTPGTPAAQAAAVAPVRENEPPGKSVNIQVELTISDQMGTEAPEKKVVSFAVADGTYGRVRASAAAIVGGERVPLDLNVDARPRLLAGDAIRLELTLQYAPAGPSKIDPGTRPTNLNQSLTVILQNGKPLTISRAVDPASNRRVTVDATATVQR